MRFSILSGCSQISLSAASHFYTPRATCDPTHLSTTVGTYTAREGHIIRSISSLVDRDICDIARLRRMADALLPLTTGENLPIPPKVCRTNQYDALFPRCTRHTSTSSRADHRPTILPREIQFAMLRSNSTSLLICCWLLFKCLTTIQTRCWT